MTSWTRRRSWVGGTARCRTSAAACAACWPIPRRWRCSFEYVTPGTAGGPAAPIVEREAATRGSASRRCRAPRTPAPTLAPPAACRPCRPSRRSSAAPRSAHVLAMQRSDLGGSQAGERREVQEGPDATGRGRRGPRRAARRRSVGAGAAGAVGGSAVTRVGVDQSLPVRVAVEAANVRQLGGPSLWRQRERLVPDLEVSSVASMSSQSSAWRSRARVILRW